MKFGRLETELHEEKQNTQAILKFQTQPGKYRRVIFRHGNALNCCTKKEN